MLIYVSNTCTIQYTKLYLESQRC